MSKQHNMRLMIFAHLVIIVNTLPVENDKTPSASQGSIFGNAVNLVTDGIRRAVKTTKNISDLMIAEDTSRTRGFTDWLASLFSCFSTPKTVEDITLTINNTNDFNNKVKDSKKPVLVMYSFGGCKACDVVGPKLANHILTLKGKVLYAKVNTDYVSVPEKNTLSSYPSIQMFKKGKMSERKGPTDAQNNYVSFINNFVNSN